jgi:hypothetical protein
MIKDYIKKKWAHYHLRYRCKKCPNHRKQTRDVLGKGECFWYEHWNNGNYEIPMWMGIINFVRCKLDRPIKVRMEPLTFKEKVWINFLRLSAVILILFLWRKI